MTKRNHLKRFDKSQLRRWLLLFFLALVVPTALLIQQSFKQLKWEAFHQHQVMADELFNRINGQLIRLVNAEEQRPFTDYSFLNVAGTSASNFLQHSPLSRYPLQAEIPGLIGYFQVDAAGKLTTPLMPDGQEKANSYGISQQEMAARNEAQNRILQILSDNRLVRNEAAKAEISYKDAEKNVDSSSQPDSGGASREQDSKAPTDKALAAQPETPAKPAAAEGQAVFDQLRKMPPKKSQQQNNLGRLEDLGLKHSYPTSLNEEKQKDKVVPAAEAVQKKMRTEQIILPEPAKRARQGKAYGLEKEVPQAAEPSQVIDKPIRIRTFESTIDPFEFSQLDSGHLVLFRKVWLNGQRYIQGILINQDLFSARYGQCGVPRDCALAHERFARGLSRQCIICF